MLHDVQTVPLFHFEPVVEYVVWHVWTVCPGFNFPICYQFGPDPMDYSAFNELKFLNTLSSLY